MIPLALIGVGPHAQRIYLPALRQQLNETNVHLALAVEIEKKRTETVDHLRKSGFPETELLTVPGGSTDGRLAPEVAELLDHTATRLGIRAAIISTEPTVHLDYLRWATEKGVHVLTDKPVVVFDNIANDPALGARIVRSFDELTDAARATGAYAAVNAQRRFHPGFNRVSEAVREAAIRFGCPITSMQSFHCDGQWRLPPEIKTQSYHPYNTGYGKLAHSGYHILDIQATLAQEAAEITGIHYSSAKTYTQCVRPDGFLHQVKRSTYESLFGDQWNEYCLDTDDAMAGQFRSYGELDVNISTSFQSDTTNTLLSQITLLHNGFARRSWMLPGNDLYKGNGRVKHEYHNFEQGPFQCIQVHSYQASDQHDSNTENDLEWGGNSHFDIYIYRNADLWGDRKPMEKITASQLNQSNGLRADRLMTEQVKHNVVGEFLSVVEGRMDPGSTRSSLASHRLTNQLLGMAYESLARDTPVKRGVS